MWTSRALLGPKSWGPVRHHIGTKYWDQSGTTWAQKMGPIWHHVGTKDGEQSRTTWAQIMGTSPAQHGHKRWGQSGTTSAYNMESSLAQRGQKSWGPVWHNVGTIRSKLWSFYLLEFSRCLEFFIYAQFLIIVRRCFLSYGTILHVWSVLVLDHFLVNQYIIGTSYNDTK